MTNRQIHSFLEEIRKYECPKCSADKKRAAWVRRYRKAFGFTQQELAKKVGTTQSAIAAIEGGRRAIGASMAKRLARVFNLRRIEL